MANANKPGGDAATTSETTAAPAQSSGDTVTIGCKLPHGLIMQVPGSAPVKINGANSSNIIGGHGITEGVSKELWDKWRVLYRDFKALVNGHIFAHDKTVDTAAEAKEKINNKTGLEGLDPQKPSPGVVPENYEGMPKKA